MTEQEILGYFRMAPGPKNLKNIADTLDVDIYVMRGILHAMVVRKKLKEVFPEPTLEIYYEAVV